MILYRVLGKKDRLNEGWFTYRHNYCDNDDVFRPLYFLTNEWIKENVGYYPEDLHRSPDVDPGICDFWKAQYYKGRNRDWYCAFQTKEHLTNVFRGEDQRAYMSEIGVRLAIFKVLKKNLRLGEDQCLFRLKDAYDITYYPLSHIESV